MTIQSAMSTAVSGTNATGKGFENISKNIANAQTNTYTAIDTFYKNIEATGSSGGVIAVSRLTQTQQGNAVSTGRALDVSINGRGYVPGLDTSGNVVFSRDLSLSIDKNGNLVNSESGFFVLGLADLDSSSTAQLIENLDVINVTTSSGSASPTDQIDFKMNLDAEQQAYLGSGDVIDYANASSHSENQNLSQYDIIWGGDADGAPTAIFLAQGDGFTVDIGSSTYTYTYGGIEDSGDITTGLGFFGSTDATTPFSTGITNGDGFTIATSGTSAVTFTFVSTQPSAEDGEFNSLATLASAIDAQDHLSARVVNGILYISPLDADESMTFANTGATDFLTTMSLANVAGGSNRFSTLYGLYDQISNSAGLQGVVEDPLVDATLGIYTQDPLGTIQFSNSAASDFLTEFNLSGTAFAASYDPLDSTKNISDGTVDAHYERIVRIYDSLGAGHDIVVGFLKLDDNTWGIEGYVEDPNELILPATQTDGRLFSGTVTFNGDGSLRSISSGLATSTTVSWSNGSAASTIDLGLGTAGQITGTVGASTIGLKDGLRQLAADYTVDSIDQNGTSPGLLTKVEIDEQGYVIAFYSNGDSQTISQLLLADFASPNDLELLSNNLFRPSTDSGEYNLKLPGSGGVGVFIPGTLQASNVDIAEQFTDMIVTQRSFQANLQVVSKADEILQGLIQSI